MLLDVNKMGVILNFTFLPSEKEKSWNVSVTLVR
jgi:hypothetical protein